MKRFLLLISSVFLLLTSSFANHITGGEMFYTYKGRSGANYLYHVTLKLYRDCYAPPGSAELDQTASIGIFDKATGVLLFDSLVSLRRIETLNLGSPSPCITNPPLVCYQVGYYEFDLPPMPGSPNGYIVAYQRCCRIAGINNLSSSNSVGTTYSAEIPGISVLPSAPENNSARFIGPDTVIVCANNAFRYSFAAIDDDGDPLTYSFCNAYVGGSTGDASPIPPAGPPYAPVPYQLPFSGAAPLGNRISIDPLSGLLTGVAPNSGIYVVTVCVYEHRNGFVIATQRKDLQIKIGDCNIARAVLEPQYITCDGFTMGFENLNRSPLINSFFWDFGVVGSTTDTSSLAAPVFTYPDTGSYLIKLVTNRNQQCSDSTTSIVKVFPGFFPGFNAAGGCFTNPFSFTDVTNTTYGVVDTWSWDFGDATSSIDVSNQQNPHWTYSVPGPKTVTFIVTNSKGCKDTVQKTVDVFDKPPITLAFRDTLICTPDVLQLNASGTGVFSWSPLTNIINPGTATPTVNPSTTTTYFVDLNDNGCVNRDSVRVRVVSFVTLVANNDTTICQGDAIQLGAISDGLLFNWTPAANLDNPALLNPTAITNSTTTYQITGRIGSCSATDELTVTTVPYPIANAGNDTVICYNTTAQLHGSHDGISFSWIPPSYLDNPNSLNPFSNPPRTTTYVLSSLDNKGCPKPGLDSVVVTVLPRVRAFAGRDTSVVVDQPLQFHGSGGVGYLWSPGIGLNSTTIADPIGIYTSEIDSVIYKLIVSDEAGCEDSASVKVKVFKTNPYVFVPTAFTPNNDGRNDLLRPIAVGIKRINYFSVYNRWGQLVFTTTENGRGWDGMIGGKPQNTDTFVWMVSASDYIDRPFFLKGTATLIR